MDANHTPNALANALPSRLPDGVMWLDGDGRLLHLNPAGQTLLRISSRRWAGKNLSAFLAPPGAAAVVSALGEIVSGKRTEGRWEVSAARIPDRKLELAFSAVREKDALAGISGTLRDATREREEAARLRELAAVLSSLQETVIITDRRRRIAYVNPATERMLGYQPGEMLHRPAAAFFEGIPGNPPHLADVIAHHAGKLGWEGEVFNRCKNGRVIPVYLSLTPMVAEGGETVGFVGVSHDISKMRELEDARRRRMERVEEEVRRRTEELQRITRDMAGQRSQLDAILSNIAEGVVVENEHYQVEFMNQTMVRRFGNQVGKKCYEAFIGRSSPCPVCGVKEVIAEGKDYFRYESTDKQGRRYELVASPLVQPDGRRLAIEIVRDITERKKTEDLIRQKNLQLTEINQELKKLLQVKSEFLSLISHELKSPLTVVQGYLTLLKDKQMGSLNPEQEEGLSVAAVEAEHLNYLINQILDLSQLDSGKFELVSEEIDIKAILDNCLAALRSEAKKSRVSFRTRISPAAVRARGDGNKIKQVFRNILENALKFSPAGGTVAIRGEKKEGGLVYSVSDRGIGVPEDELEKIFDRFYQVKTPLTIKYGGMGLGLAISKNIVELHQGRIWAESGPGRGATVFFTLPRDGTDKKGSVR
ncbi:MAG: PAS domain-containing protein [Candidatus Aureabacteria bacterium]|nr:PAS domain-containing protein [Candidatus Auribacterota bacterium]